MKIGNIIGNNGFESIFNKNYLSSLKITKLHCEIA